MLNLDRSQHSSRQTSLLNAILEATADGILVIDLNGSMVRYNRKFVEIWGIPPEIMGAKEDELAVNFVRSQLKNPTQFSDKIKELYAYPNKESYDLLEFHDGRVCERYSKPQILTNKIIGRVWSFRDVTEKIRAEKALREAKWQLDCTLAAISDFVWSAFVERSGPSQSHFYSPPIEKMTGRSPQYYMEGNDRWLNIIHADDIESYQRVIRKLVSGAVESSVFEYRVFHADERVLHIRDSMSSYVCEDGRIRLDGICSDVTAKYCEVQERESLLQKESHLRQGAENAVKERDLFISIASHELKNPLNNLQLRLELLSKNSGSKDLGLPVQEQLLGCRKSVDRFRQLVDELLDLTRFQSRGCVLHRQAFDLSELVRDQLSQFELEFERKSCEVFSQLPESLEGIWDKVKIGQVITNLFSNSLKYAAGKSVEIKLYQKNDFAVLEVKDHGVGMTPENLAKIFQLYSRFENSTSESGLGLGLYISKQIAEAHGGDLAVESSIGLGSVFSLSLPL